MKHSEKGIPILPLQEKVRALNECLSSKSNEDAAGHLFDLLALVRENLKKQRIVKTEEWSDRALLELYGIYRTDPTPIKDEPES